jgi:hypothetical protein
MGRSRKKSVSKTEISTPTFISGGMAVSTVDLPPGASLSNGREERGAAPPLPAMNPNRRRGRVQTTQNVYTAFGGPAMNESQSQPNSAHPDHDDFPSPRDQAMFSDGEHVPRFGKVRPRMRSAAGDGGHSAAKARHNALMREAETETDGMDGYVNGVGGRNHKRPETHVPPVS